MSSKAHLIPAGVTALVLLTLAVTSWSWEYTAARYVNTAGSLIALALWVIDLTRRAQDDLITRRGLRVGLAIAFVLFAAAYASLDAALQPSDRTPFDRVGLVTASIGSLIWSLVFRPADDDLPRQGHTYPWERAVTRIVRRVRHR